MGRFIGVVRLQRLGMNNRLSTEMTGGQANDLYSRLNERKQRNWRPARRKLWRFKEGIESIFPIAR
ncbi:hypothetical protein OLK001_01150 [Synechocystis sp. LKSZ1]